MDKLAIAVAGAGLIGRRHIELIHASGSCELAAIVDPSPAVAEVARASSVALYGSLGELFDALRPDGVIIATPNRMHVAQALECIDAGVAALVEKPLAHTVEEGERLCRAVDATGARVLVGHHRHHNPLIARAYELVQGGALGRLVSVTGSAMFYKPDDYFAVAPWRLLPGGGPILINMIHEIGVLRALCGEIVAVQALSSNAARGHAVEDTVAIGLRFANGALGTFMLSDCSATAANWEHASGENAQYPNYPDEDCYLVAGTRGSLAIPTMRLKTYANDADRSWWKPFQARIEPTAKGDPLVLQLEHFCNVIRGSAKPLVSARDGLQNLRVTEAIAKAGELGTIVEVDTG